jgi:tetrahydromethanopterin S-methyltransferase subunit B
MPANQKTEIAVLVQEVRALKEQIDRMDKDVKASIGAINNGFVTKAEFQPVKQLVFGAAGIILTAVVGSIVFLVMRAAP